MLQWVTCVQNSLAIRKYKKNHDRSRTAIKVKKRLTKIGKLTLIHFRKIRVVNIHHGKTVIVSLKSNPSISCRVWVNLRENVLSYYQNASFDTFQSCSILSYSLVSIGTKRKCSTSPISSIYTFLEELVGLYFGKAGVSCSPCSWH